MRFLLLGLALMVAACGASGRTIVATQAECGYDQRPFEQAWPCVKRGIVGQKPQDVVAQYSATGDVVAERVKAGQMTDAEAKLAMAKALQEATSITAGRYNAAYGASGGGPTVYQRVGPQTVIGY